MKLTLKEINDTEFIKAVNTVLSTPLPAVASWNFCKIANSLQSEQLEFEKIRIGTLKKYSKLNEKCEIDLDENNVAKFESEENKKKYQEELEQLLKQEVEIATIEFTTFGSEVLIEPKVFMILNKVII